MAVDKKTGLDDALWTIQLRDDQMDCVVECLSWLMKQHDSRIANRCVTDIDEFAHREAKARIADTLAVFTEVGHRS